MNKQFRFEIVRRGGDRYYWLFVAVKRGRRRVLARSARDYRSPEKATQAIDTLRDTEYVLDPTDDPFHLPATSFRIVSGVVPLMVSEFPVEDSSAAEYHATRRAANGAESGPAAAQGAAGSAAKPAAAKRSRASAASRSRKRAAPGKGKAAAT